MLSEMGNSTCTIFNCRIGDHTATYCLRDHDNTAGIGDKRRRDRQYRRESDPMLNSILNVDWTNSVPRRQFPKGNSAAVLNQSFNGHVFPLLW